MKIKYLILILIFLMIVSGCKSKPSDSSSDIKVVSDNIILDDCSAQTISVIESKTETSSTEIVSSNAGDFSSYKPKANNNSSGVPEKPKNTSKPIIPNISPPKKTDSTVSEIQKPIEPKIPKVKDEIWIANRVFEILNEERRKIGVHERTMLDGLNKIAVFRSKQLVTQFSHTWTENGKTYSGSRYVANKLKYGKLIDVTVYGDVPENNYYDYTAAGENCCGGGGYINEDIAISIIDSFKKSSGHWLSLMSEKAYYDGIGITFGVNPEYPDVECWCSVNSSIENYG